MTIDTGNRSNGSTESEDRCCRTRVDPNRLGIWGWLGGGRWGFERYLYTLHRLTGLGLLAYFLLHIVVTSCARLGEQSWEASMARVAGPLFVVGEYLVFAAFAFHAANGIRLGARRTRHRRRQAD